MIEDSDVQAQEREARYQKSRQCESCAADAKFLIEVFDFKGGAILSAVRLCDNCAADKHWRLAALGILES
jgi:hypothetical protein